MRSAWWAVVSAAGLAMACGPHRPDVDVPVAVGPIEHSGTRVEVGSCYDPVAAAALGSASVGGGWRGMNCSQLGMAADVDVAGELDRELVLRHLRRKRRDLRRCYDVYRRADPSLGGTVDISFAIEPDGRVSGARTEGVSERVAACVADVISRMVFPSPAGGGVVHVTYSIEFRSDSERSAPKLPGLLGFETAGPLSKDTIRQVIQDDALPQVRYCYESMLYEKPGVQGELVVQLTIESDGSVSSVVAAGVDPWVEQCVAQVISYLRFPREPGEPVKVRYPFKLVPSDTNDVAPAASVADFDPAVVRPAVERAAACFADHVLSADPNAFGTAAIDLVFDGGALSDVAVDYAPGGPAIECVTSALATVALDGGSGEVRCDVAYGWEQVGNTTPVVEVGATIAVSGVAVAPVSTVEGEAFARERIDPLHEVLLEWRGRADPSASLFVIRAAADVSYGAVWRAAFTAYAAGFSALRIERAAGAGGLVYASRAPMLEDPALSNPTVSVISILVSRDEVHAAVVGVEQRYMVTHLDTAPAVGLIADSIADLRAAAGDAPRVVVEVAAAPDTPFEQVASVLQVISAFDPSTVYLMLPELLTSRLDLVQSSQ